jgi:hypothetical protein
MLEGIKKSGGLRPPLAGPFKRRAYILGECGFHAMLEGTVRTSNAGRDLAHQRIGGGRGKAGG